MLRFLTAGESHGPALVVIVDGVPSGLPIDFDAIAVEMRRRQGGYGRGRRMQIESDSAEVLSGIRAGRTTGGPVSFLIRNRDWENWQQTMHVGPEPPPGATGAARKRVTRPRPGHADLAGGLKYDHADLRDVIERASARETAARVAAGALARQILGAAGVQIASHVIAIGDLALGDASKVTFERARAIPDRSPLHCVDAALEARMVEAIDRAREAGDTLGGAFEVIAHDVPAGLGSYAQWDRRLDGRLAQAFMSIPAIKAVGIGLGPALAALPGSRAHDEILPSPLSRGRVPGLTRPSNKAGGLEGGVTNGEDVRVIAYMKPISTLMKPLASVDLDTMASAEAAIERSDVCAVPAAAVVGEAAMSLTLADALLETFGGDTIADLQRNLRDRDERRTARLTSAAPPEGDREKR
jgi:chorismate synthase